jgi:hypothetical protein
VGWIAATAVERKLNRTRKKRKRHYLLSLCSSWKVRSIERVAKVASQLPQWLLLRLPIHLVVEETRCDKRLVESASSTGAPPKMWERAPFVSPDQKKGLNLRSAKADLEMRREVIDQRYFAIRNQLKLVGDDLRLRGVCAGRKKEYAEDGRRSVVKSKNRRKEASHSKYLMFI